MTRKKLKLQKPPQIFVLAQVVVDQYLNVGKRIPDLQEGLREYDFIDIVEVEEQFVDLNPKEKEFRVGNSKLWHFHSSDKKTRLTVTPKSVVLQMSDYKNFEGFISLMGKCIEQTNEAWTGGHRRLMRLGLRYVNVIKPEDANIPSSVFVSPCLRGVNMDKAPMPLNYRRTENFVVYGNEGVLSIRFSDLPGQSPIPAGVERGAMIFRDDLPKKSDSFGVLDLDRYVEGDFEYDSKNVLTQLTKFHDDVEEAFLRSLTDVAKKEWGVEYES